MNTHPYPSPTSTNRLAAALARPMAPVDAVLLGLWVLVGLAGCIGYNAATANRDITSVIAGAGAAANQAEQAYQNKTISQTTGARTTINNLGAAYEQARAAYLAVLEAEQIYRNAENMQLTSCVPSLAAASAGSASNCATITQSASAAQTKLQAAEAALNAKITALAVQTKAVKALK